MTQAQVLIGSMYEAGGVRILVHQGIDALKEAASGLRAFDLNGDYNLSASAGSVQASASSIHPDNDLEGNFAAANVYRRTFFVAEEEFGQQKPGALQLKNARHDGPDLVEHPLLKIALTRQRPSGEGVRYDKRILQRSLDTCFETKMFHQLDKTNLILAHEITADRTALFGHLDPNLFSAAGLEYLNMGRAGTTPIYNDVSVVDGIMAASAIPGFIGYHRIESLDRSFADLGAINNSSLFNIVDDLHDMRANHIRLNTPASAPLSGWRKFLTKQSAPEETLLVSRLVVYGVGHENGSGFNENGGLLSELPTLIRSFGNAATDSALAAIRKKYDAASRAHTPGKLPAVRIINTSILPDAQSPYGQMPSGNVLDGRVENLLLMGNVIKKACVENRVALCEEMNFAMQVKHQRNPQKYTRQMVDAVAQNIETRLGNDQAVCDLCDTFLVTANDVDHLFEKRKRQGRSLTFFRGAKAPTAEVA